jgi:Tol biopolymer transport system component
VAVIALALTAVRLYERPAEALTSRFEIQTPELRNPYQVSISPDGAKVVFVASRPDGKVALFIRPIESVAAQPLAGTEGAILPFWSPDSQFIGYADPQNRKLKKVSIKGGPPQIICDAPYSGNFVATGAWSPNGVIVFSNGDANQPLYRVAAGGGVPAQLTTLDKTLQEGGHTWPWFLPDGRHFLYTVWSSKPQNRSIYVSSLDSDKRTRVMSSESMVEYAPPGVLFFERENGLFAQRFDDKRLTLSGEPVLIADSVISNPANGRVSFAVSSNGTLIYRSGHTELPLTWVDRGGKAQSVAAEPGSYEDPSLSPDQKRLAFEKTGGTDGDLWILDLIHGSNTRFTFDASRNSTPIWSSDGKRVAFSSDRGGTYNLFVKSSEEAGNDELLLKSDHKKSATDWSADGRYILYTDITPSLDDDLWVLPMEGDRKPFVFLKTPFREAAARLSPDGQWVTYQSNESGKDEVYVQSFPTPGNKSQISNAGGTAPKWRADGKEIFYRSGNALMVVDVVRAEPGKGVAVGPPRVLFQAAFSSSNLYPYDVSRDGQRFILNGFAQSTALPPIPITVVLNWPAVFNKK